MNNLAKKILLFSIAAVLLLTLACGRTGTENKGQAPIIEITSYEGVADTTDIDQDNPELYVQDIFWNAYDEDGVVEGVAYRVKDMESGEYIETPNNDVIDENGWVYHYKEGADEEVPLESPNAVKSIWTNDTRTRVWFPAANEDGETENHVSLFEVKCIDNRGNESEIVKKYFYSEGLDYTVDVQTTKGTLAGSKIGRGIKFQFSFKEDYNYIDDTALGYEYKFYKATLEDSSMIEGTETSWYSTLDSDKPDIAPVTWRDNDELAEFFKTDYVENDSTVVQDRVSAIVVKGYDYAGGISEESTVFFSISDEFTPDTVIYPRTSFGIGKYHYGVQLFNNDAPTQTTPDGTHFAIPLFVETDTTNVALLSNDLQLHLSWGYHGEYKNDNPNAKKQSVVYSAGTLTDYKSEIVYYDIRLDNAPFYFPPLDEPQNYTEDTEGNVWLRVPVSNPIAQKIVLTNLEAKTYKLEVRAVDLQGVADVEPAVFEFEVVDPFAIEKDDLLIIDDTEGNFSTPAYPNVDTVIKERYTQIAEALNTEAGIEYNIISRKEILDMGLPNYFGTDNSNLISPTELLKYKNVLYYSDVLSFESTNIAKEFDGLHLYSKFAGKLIFSASSNLAVARRNLDRKSGAPLSYDGFGLVRADTVGYLKKTSSVPIEKAYFIGANSESSYPSLALDIDNAFTPFIAQLDANGLETIGLINDVQSTVENIYSFNSKAVGADQYAPADEEERNKYQGRKIGIKNVVSLGENGSFSYYLFSFPLSFMETGLEEGQDTGTYDLLKTIITE